MYTSAVSFLRYLEPHGLVGGACGHQLLQVSLPVILKDGACQLVVPVPLDDEASIEVILLRVLAPDGQEVPSSLHLQYPNVPCSFRDQCDINIT